MLLSGPAGVGKTTAASQMPRPYIIDTEQGSVHYGDMIEKSGGVVAELTDASEVIRELRSLITEKHDYATVVIDPVTTLWEQALAEGEQKVGTEYGKHYGWANNLFKRMCNLLTAIDMNVIVTAHEKDDFDTQVSAEGKAERVKVGVTYDGYKKLDYIFDLWCALRRRSKNEPGSARIATVMKTRLDAFPDRDEFEWSYDALAKRYGRDGIEAKVETVTLASPEQVARLMNLIGRLSEDELGKLKLKKVATLQESELSDMPAERIANGIELIESHFKNAAA